MNRQLYRSSYNKMLAGVCGGIGEYFGIDPTIIRIIWVILAFSGVGILAYIVAAIIIPEENPSGYGYNGGHMGGSGEYGNHSTFDNRNASLIIGGILIFIGALLIARRYLWWIDTKLLWSIVLIVIGLIIIFKGGRGFNGK